MQRASPRVSLRRRPARSCFRARRRSASSIRRTSRSLVTRMGQRSSSRRNARRRSRVHVSGDRRLVDAYGDQRPPSRWLCRRTRNRHRSDACSFASCRSGARSSSRTCVACSARVPRARSTRWRRRTTRILRRSSAMLLSLSLVGQAQARAGAGRRRRRVRESLVRGQRCARAHRTLRQFRGEHRGGARPLPEVHNRIHFVRRTIKPAWLDALVNRRMRSAGFGTIGQARLAGPHARAAGERRRDRVPVRPACRAARRHRRRFLRPPGGNVQEPGDHRARDRRAGAPGVGWREPDGTHVLRVEAALPVIAADADNDAIRATRAPTTRRSSASSCVTPSNGGGCTGAGRPLRLC